MAFQKRIFPGVRELLSKIQQSVQNAVLPIGTIVAYHGKIADIPSGWAVCDGKNGTPNLVNRYLRGHATTSGTMVNAGLPNITGSIFGDDNPTNPSGAFADVWIGNWAVNGWGIETTAGGHYHLRFDASRSNSIYGASSTVTPLTCTVIYIMKVA